MGLDDLGEAGILTITQMINNVLEEHPYLDYYNASRMAVGIGSVPFRFDKINQDDLSQSTTGVSNA